MSSKRSPKHAAPLSTGRKVRRGKHAAPREGARRRTGAAVAALTVGLTGAMAGVAVADANTHKVQKGDTLAAIAADHGFDGSNGWRKLFDANAKIDDPDHIEPGQVLDIPERGEKLERRKLPSAAPAEAAAPSRTTSTAASRSGSRTETAPAPQPAAPSSGVWSQLAACESGGNWAANTGNGYYGGLQFSLSSWQAVGGSGYPHEASAGTQIAMAERLRASQGWGAWPSCSAKLGLR